MQFVINNFTRWLNALLIVTLLTGMLPPKEAVAAFETGQKLARSFDDFIFFNPDSSEKIFDSETSSLIPLSQIPLFLERFNPISSGWTFVNYVSVDSTDGFGDAYSLRITEQSGITSNTSWAEKTITMPPNLNSLYLSFYNKRCPGANGGYFRVYIDGVNVLSEINSPGNWTLKTLSTNLAGYTNDGSVTIRIVIESYYGVHCTLFDDILFFTDDDIGLPADQTLSPNECPLCGNQERQRFVGGPINSFSGNYTYQAADFNLAAVGRPLRFERTYNSLPVTGTVVYTRPLGYGWTHSYDLQLALAADRAVLKAPHGSRMGFTLAGGVYQADPGVWGTLVSGGGLYTVTAANQESYVFNSGGQLTRQLDPQGNATDLTRTNGLTLTRVTDAASGRYLDLGYDGQGRLSTVTDSTNRVTRYLYDAADNLSQVVDTRGFTWTYTYTGAHLLHAITDPTNKVVERTYFDEQGRATRQENGAGQPVTQISYLDTRRVVTEAGRVITDTYNGLGLWISQSNAANQTESYTFDAAFNRTGKIDGRNNPATYTRTPLGLTTAITDALNGVTRFGYDGRNNLTTVTDARNNPVNYTYDGQNNLKTVTTVSGTTVYTTNNRGQVTARRDANGGVTQYNYDGAGNLTQIIDPQAQTAQLQYDNLGRLTLFTDTRTIVTRYEYDPADHLTRLTENYRSQSCPATECNLLTQYGYDNAGRLYQVIDPLARQTRYSFDAAGRVSQLIRNYQNGVHESGEAVDRDVITGYTYDNAGRLDQLTDPLGRTTRLFYNPLNQVQQTILNYVDGDYNTNLPDEDVKTTYNYDAAGNLTLLTNNANETTTLTYDALNRLTGIQTPVAAVQYRYDAVGNRTTMIDPNTYETRYGYDALNRLTAVIENYTGGGQYTGIPDQNITTRFGYDPAGNLTQIVNPKSQIVNLQYDSLNRLTALLNPLTQTTRYGYDALGNTTAITDANLQVTTLTYDPVNRLTHLNYPGATPAVTFGYDQAGHRLTMTDGTGSTGYIYDNLDRLTRLQAPTGNLQYSYDLNGNRLSLTTPATQTVTYSYDGLNRLQTVTDWSSGRYTYTYSAAGRPADLTRPNGVKTGYGYDPAGRLTGLTHQSGLSTIAAYAYTLDPAGNRRQVVETIPVCAQLAYLPIIMKSGGGNLSKPVLPTPDSTFTSPIAAPQEQAASGPVDFIARFNAFLPVIWGGPALSLAGLSGNSLQAAALSGLPAACRPLTLTRTLVYTYDHLYRLTNANYSTGERYAYTYDAAGNRLTQTALTRTTVYTYDAANRLTHVNGQAYTWDNNGNLLRTGTMTHTYDAANRLTQVVSGSVTTQFQYNGDGDRVRQTVGATTTIFALDAAGGLPEVISTSAGDKYLHLPGGIAQQKAGQGMTYLLPDGLGSVRQAVDSAGVLAGFYNYDPYGAPVPTPPLPVANPYGYTGEWWESQPGLLHLRARWYDPAKAIFLSKDPWMGHRLWSSSRNGWNYAAGNPVNLVDPSGLRPDCKSPECAVQLVSTQIQQLWPLLTSFRHLTILFRNSNEDIYVIEGMPENAPITGNPGQLEQRGPFENQNSQEVATPLGMVERGEGGARLITVDQGEDVCDKWRCIKNKMQILETLDIPYGSLGPNSNTAVYSVLKACHLPISGPQYDTEDMWRHIGWAMDLSPFLQNDIYQAW